MCGHFVDHRAGKLVLAVFEEKPFQPVHAVEFLLVEQQAGRVDRTAVNLCAPTANSVKVLKRDTPRIDLRMA